MTREEAVEIVTALYTTGDFVEKLELLGLANIRLCDEKGNEIKPAEKVFSAILASATLEIVDRVLQQTGAPLLVYEEGNRVALAITAAAMPSILACLRVASVVLPLVEDEAFPQLIEITPENAEFLRRIAEDQRRLGLNEAADKIDKRVDEAVPRIDEDFLRGLRENGG